MSHYKEVDPMELDEDGEYYFRHVLAMTKEKLHSKADIAKQLGVRDREIDKLREELAAQRTAFSNALNYMTMGELQKDEIRMQEYENTIGGTVYCRKCSMINCRPIGGRWKDNCDYCKSDIRDYIARLSWRPQALEKDNG
jgi:hypothetical protein